MSKLGTWFFAILALVALAYAIWKLAHPSGSGGLLLLAIMCVPLAAGCAHLLNRTRRQFPRAETVVDEDGLWPGDVGKADGLVRWQDIASIKENRRGQRLELRDEAGNTLAKLEYQLDDFEELRQLVLDRMQKSQALTTCPVVFAKPWFYHAGTLSVVVILLLLGSYTSYTETWGGLLLLGAAVFFIVLDYLTTVCRLTIDRRVLNIRFPLRRVGLSIAEIDSILIEDIYLHGRVPTVVVSGKSVAKPVRLKWLGLDATTLYAYLELWKNEKLFV